MGASYPERKKIIESIAKIDVYGTDAWQYLSSKKYKGQISSADYYQTISKYKSFLCLMELNDPTPHLNAKIFDAIVAGVIPITPYYEPFDKTYELPSGSYYRYNNPAEVGALIDTINDLSEEEYNIKIDNLRKSQSKFSYHLQYLTLLNSINRLGIQGLREWIACLGFFQKRHKIINRMVEILILHDIQKIPLRRIFHLKVPSRFSPFHLNQKGSICVGWPVLDRKKATLNLSTIKICCW